jgi:hypothetical protein
MGLGTAEGSRRHHRGPTGIFSSRKVTDQSGSSGSRLRVPPGGQRGPNGTLKYSGGRSGPAAIGKWRHGTRGNSQKTQGNRCVIKGRTGAGSGSAKPPVASRVRSRPGGSIGGGGRDPKWPIAPTLESPRGPKAAENLASTLDAGASAWRPIGGKAGGLGLWWRRGSPGTLGYRLMSRSAPCNAAVSG